MGSYDFGKDVVCEKIRRAMPVTARGLDVGACDGKWSRLLPEYWMDAVEPFADNAANVGRNFLYRFVFNCTMQEFIKEHENYYDFVLFGDVLEHMTPADAKECLEWAEDALIVISVPFEYKQGPLYGNPYEEHIQDDLTPDIFDERYPGYKVIHRAAADYWYYSNREI